MKKLLSQRIESKPPKAKVGMLMGESYKTVASSAAGVNFDEKNQISVGTSGKYIQLRVCVLIVSCGAAFADGMKLGREELSTEKAGISQTADRTFAEYSALGKWCVLLQAACLLRTRLNFLCGGWFDKFFQLAKKVFRKEEAAEGKTITIWGM